MSYFFRIAPKQHAPTEVEKWAGARTDIGYYSVRRTNLLVILFGAKKLVVLSGDTFWDKETSST